MTQDIGDYLAVADQDRPRRPVLLDLFCKAGGAGMGYHRAGFDVVGVWMTRDELSQAIPPAYTEWIGRQLRSVLDDEAEAVA